MKTIYTTLFAALISLTAFSQSTILASRGGHHPQNPVNRSGNPSSQAMMGFYVDYGAMDEDFQVNQQSLPAYTRYIWDMNMNYKLTNGDTSLRWAAVDFSPLYNTDYAAGFPYAQVASSSYSTINIDTIFFNAGHSNYSGANDTVLVRILQCSAAGYPTSTAVILHTDTIITNTSMTQSATWLSNGTFYVAPNFLINNNTTKFAVRIEYYGNALDTFGMTAGFGDLGPGQCPSNASLPNFAMVSNYAINSYRQDMRFAPPLNTYDQLPSSAGGDTYYECNGTAGHQVGADSENFLQNWDLWIHVTTDPASVNEVNSNLNVGQNVPNPSNGETQIPYSLKNNSIVTLTIVDVVGNQVLTQTENASVGHHNFDVATSNLSAGVYFYTVGTNQGSITHKMIVQ